MKPIKFIEADGTVKMFNPLYVVDAKISHTEGKDSWCLSIYIPTGRDSVYIKVYDTQEDAQIGLEYVMSCIA